MHDDDAPVDIGLLGHIGPYYPYDPDDPNKPIPKKRAFPFGFAAPKSRRPPKRANKEKVRRYGNRN